MILTLALVIIGCFCITAYGAFRLASIADDVDEYLARKVADCPRAGTAAQSGADTGPNGGSFKHKSLSRSHVQGSGKSV